MSVGAGRGVAWSLLWLIMLYALCGTSSENGMAALARASGSTASERSALRLAAAAAADVNADGRAMHAGHPSMRACHAEGRSIRSDSPPDLTLNLQR